MVSYLSHYCRFYWNKVKVWVLGLDTWSLLYYSVTRVRISDLGRSVIKSLLPSFTDSTLCVCWLLWDLLFHYRVETWLEAVEETDRSLICLFILAVTFHFVSGILPLSLSYSCSGCHPVNSWHCCVKQRDWCASLATFLKTWPYLDFPLDLDLSPGLGPFPWTWTFLSGLCHTLDLKTPDHWYRM